MSKQCEIVQDLLPLYVDGACSEASAEMIKEHLETCADCRAIYEQMLEKYGYNLDNPDILRSTLRILSRRSNETKSKNDSEHVLYLRTDEILHKLMLPVHCSGYYYLRNALIRTALRETKLPDVSCKLYDKNKHGRGPQTKMRQDVHHRIEHHAGHSTGRTNIV